MSRAPALQAVEGPRLVAQLNRAGRACRRAK